MQLALAAQKDSWQDVGHLKAGVTFSSAGWQWRPAYLCKIPTEPSVHPRAPWASRKKARPCIRSCHAEPEVNFLLCPVTTAVRALNFQGVLSAHDPTSVSVLTKVLSMAAFPLCCMFTTHPPLCLSPARMHSTQYLEQYQMASDIPLRC